VVGNCRGAMPATVTILSASSLRGADWTLSGATSDPYCICEILGKAASTIQTPTIKKSLYPEWNCDGFIEEYAHGDTLLFSVYDEDWGKKDDCIGTAELKSDQLQGGKFEGTLPLVDKGRVGEAYLRVKVNTDGTLRGDSATATSREFALFSKTWTSSETGPGHMRNDVTGEVGFSFTPGTDLLVTAMGRQLGPQGCLQEEVNVTLWETEPQKTAIAKVKVGPTARIERDYAYEVLEHNKEPRLDKDKIYLLTQSCHNGMADNWYDGTIEQAGLKGCMHKECNQIQGGVQGDEVGKFPDQKTPGAHRVGMLSLKLRTAPPPMNFDNFGVRERPERLAIRFVCMSPSP